jgi:hypothetical protein
VSLTQRKPLPKLGPVKKRWASWQRSQAEIVKARACGLCEGCGKDSRPLQVAHLLGRRNLVAEPWASWSGLCAHLCSAHPSYGLGCHERLDGRKDLPLRERLLWTAAWRSNLVFGDELVSLAMAEERPEDAIRGLIRRAEALGITPDPSRELEERG